MIDVSRHFKQPNGTIHLNSSLVAFSTLQKSKQKDEWELHLVITGNSPMKLKFQTKELAEAFQSEYI